MTVAAIVLAGGRSRRFGEDKLAVLVEGRPMLDRAVGVAASVAPLVIVALAPGDDRAVIEPPDARVLLVHDEREGGGPLVGLIRALETASEAGAEVAVVVGGDMPSLRGDLLQGLLDGLSDAATEAVAPMVGGRLRPLPSALRVAPALAAARDGLTLGDGRLRGLLERLETVELDEPAWRRLDAGGESFRDVDLPEDLPADMPG